MNVIQVFLQDSATAAKWAEIREMSPASPMTYTTKHVNWGKLLGMNLSLTNLIC